MGRYMASPPFFFPLAYPRGFLFFIEERKVIQIALEVGKLGKDADAAGGFLPGSIYF